MAAEWDPRCVGTKRTVSCAAPDNKESRCSFGRTDGTDTSIRYSWQWRLQRALSEGVVPAQLCKPRPFSVSLTILLRRPQSAAPTCAIGRNIREG